jgi:hypothetical protein
VAAPGTTPSYHAYCQQAIAAEVKEAVCRVADTTFDGEKPPPPGAPPPQPGHARLPGRARPSGNWEPNPECWNHLVYGQSETCTVSQEANIGLSWGLWLRWEPPARLGYR